jgi:ribosomal protein L37AE/L43A
MWDNPAEEWRRLRELYSEKNDEELRELAADFCDLTEVAQQVLRDEMKIRGLDKPQAAIEAASNPVRPASLQGHLGDTQSNSAAMSGECDLPCEYTWKTLLCECEEREQAWQVAEVLRRAGIESWIERPQSPFGLSGRRVLVAADQLDEALQIAAQRIPQEIVDLSKIKLPDFEPPVCPSCGAADPVLEDVNPVNTWQCESCGRQWTESAPADLTENPEKTEA